ncbi:hypothetical protein ACNS7O_03190 [Haloferacaceae archaeon DSL9]
MRPLLVCASFLCLVGVAVDSGYTLAVDRAQATPLQTVTFDGETHEIDRLLVAESGEPIAATAAGPADRYGLLLCDADGDRIARVVGRGEQTHHFETDLLSPGTYLVARYDGSHRSLIPVIISGYEVSVERARNATVGSSLDLVADVTPRAETADIGAGEDVTPTAGITGVWLLAASRRRT